MSRPLLLALVVGLALISCGSAAGAPITIDDAWIQAPGGSNGLAAMTIHNAGPDDQLIGVESEIADAAELHTLVRSADLIQMNPVERLDLPSGQTLKLGSGDTHVMLIGLKRILVPGERVVLALRFAHAGRIDVAAEVRGR